ncbi:MAG: class I SAM-dependent methyltransferase [Kiritimatiellae bacterium]|nr:class I SAM-dependent methyltransferase [Kiritimatiellia bacterium]MDD5523063.1 class I SAM-dependent methyltransferase [Kiritimatiellia bacterium]
MNKSVNIGLWLKRIFGLFPPKFRWFYRDLYGREFTLLDVGCGNHSASLAKTWFPKCRYHGVDKGIYANSEEDFKLMEKFYELDLSNTSLKSLPDNFYDVVIANHIIEHLSNGLDLLREITGKIKPGGVIYVEFPSVRSMSFPSMKGTLNFCDDDTHVRVYDLKEVANVLLVNNFKVIRAGTRRTWWKFAALPLYLVYVIFDRKLLALLWEILGFAEYVYAVKKNQ